MSSIAVDQGLKFVDRVQLLLDKVEYRQAVTQGDREAIFRQRYNAYLREGAIDPDPSGRFTDEYDNTENAQVYGLYIGDRLCASMRIHKATLLSPQMPALWTFADLVGPELSAGKVIVDPSRFVVDHEASRENPELAYLTARLGWIAGEHYGADLVLSTARAEHQAFYRRVFNYRLVSECRPYKTLKKPLSLLFLDFKAQKEIVEARYPFLRSTAAERLAVFGPLKRADLRAA
jgi:N-acyl-L-homoserine lactone synthetase